MAAREIDYGIQKAINFLTNAQKNVSLKEEQLMAIKDLLREKDVLAILPTGFGKSLIYVVFLLAKQEILLKQRGRETNCSIICISPLKSIIADQISEIDSLGLSAAEITEENLDEISSSPPQFLFCSAEKAIDGRFLEALKSNTTFHSSVFAVVVDECHTVQTWTGKRKGNKPKAFRSAYGKLSILRSMCPQGIPFLALTGTADTSTEKVIATNLNLRTFSRIYVSPNRPNLKFVVNKIEREKMLNQLDWLIEIVKQQNVNTPKTIIFCSTLYDIASVVNYMMTKLGAQAFSPVSSKEKKHCLIGIYHSSTMQQYKERVTASPKQSGVKRIAVATTALSMGVNFPDIRYVLMFGPPRSLLDFHQEAGRAGRDGNQSVVILSYYGQQIAHCEDDMRMFLKSDGCRRVAAYKSLDANIEPFEPGYMYDCCDVCALQCGCQVDNCEHIESYQRMEGHTSDNNHKLRIVSDEDKQALLDSLKEIQEIFASPTEIAAFGNVSGHGFSTALITDVAENCDKIFTVEYLMTHMPVFSRSHAMKILEVVSEIFEDVDEHDLQAIDTSSASCSNSECAYMGLEELLSADYIDDENIYDPSDFDLVPNY